jgi:hypothetical protein
MLAQEHIYSTNTQVDTYSRTMSDGKSAQSESSKTADNLDSEPSQQNFDVSILGSIVPSDASHLDSISCSSSVSEEFSETSQVAPRAEEVLERCDEASEFTDKSDVSTPENTDLKLSNLDEGEVVQSIPGGRSIAHHTINNHLWQFLSIDIESGGDIAGIIQLSAEITQMKLVSTGKKLGCDKAVDCCCCPDTFNKYVQPGCAPAYWAQSSIDVHGILATDPRITGADDILTAWFQFLVWLSKHTSAAETIFLVAWNGGACDLKWLWRLTQAPSS